MRGCSAIASSTSSQVSDAKTVEIAVSTAVSDRYGRPSAMALANRPDAQHDIIRAVAAAGDDALNEARVTGPPRSETNGTRRGREGGVTRGYSSRRRQRVGPRHPRAELATALENPLLRAEVHVHKPEPLGVPLGPLEVVHQRPG